MATDSINRLSADIAIVQRLVKRASGSDAAAQLTVDLNKLDKTTLEANASGATELRDAFIGHNQPAAPSVAKVLDYVQLLLLGAKQLSLDPAAKGGVAESDVKLRESGVRPLVFGRDVTKEQRIEVAEGMLALVHAALKIDPRDPAHVFSAGQA